METENKESKLAAWVKTWPAWVEKVLIVAGFVALAAGIILLVSTVG